MMVISIDIGRVSGHLLFRVKMSLGHLIILEIDFIILDMTKRKGPDFKFGYFIPSTLGYFNWGAQYLTNLRYPHFLCYNKNPSVIEYILAILSIRGFSKSVKTTNKLMLSWHLVFFTAEMLHSGSVGWLFKNKKKQSTENSDYNFADFMHNNCQLHTICII
jgi:hypothetical protein